MDVMKIGDCLQEKHVGKWIIGLIGYNDGMFYPQAVFNTKPEALDKLEEVRAGRTKVPYVLVGVGDYFPAEKA